MSIFDGTEKPPGYWTAKVAEWAVALEARKAWERENPALATDWSAAIQEDEDRCIAAARALWVRGQADLTGAHLTDCGTPDGVAHLLTHQPATWAAMARTSAFMESSDVFLLLFGEPNTGKTVAACSAFLSLKKSVWTPDTGNTWEWHSKGGMFVSAHEVSNASYFDAEAKAKLRRMAGVRLLVLDDLGAELMSEGWRANLDALVDKRYGAKLKTILTSNVSARKEREKGEVGERSPWKVSPFEERYGARVARRVRERGTVFQAERT